MFEHPESKYVKYMKLTGEIYYIYFEMNPKIMWIDGEWEMDRYVIKHVE